MKISNFHKSFEKLKEFLEENSFPNLSVYAKLCYYTKFLDFYREVNVIIKRIEADMNTFDTYSKKALMTMVVQNKSIDKKNIPDETAKIIVDAFVKLNLDIKSFYVFTKIFLDCLAEIISIFHRKESSELKKSMTDLLKDIRNKKISDDDNFFSILEGKLKWYDSFTDDRDRIVHKYPQLKFTNTKDQKFGYKMLKELNETWGSETVKSIDDDIQEKLSYLSEILDYMTSDLKFSR